MVVKISPKNIAVASYGMIRLPISQQQMPGTLHGAGGNQVPASGYPQRFPSMINRRNRLDGRTSFVKAKAGNSCPQPDFQVVTAFDLSAKDVSHVVVLTRGSFGPPETEIIMRSRQKRAGVEFLSN